LVRGQRRVFRCTSDSARGVGRPCLTWLGNPVEGPMLTLMDSRGSRVVVNDAVRGVRHPNAIAPSRRSLWVSASTASRPTTSPLSVAPRPAAYAAGIPAIGPGPASVVVHRHASEALCRWASLQPRWRVAPGTVAPMVRGDPACRWNVAPRQVNRPQHRRLLVRPS
jgi:hypothetical protein